MAARMVDQTAGSTVELTAVWMAAKWVVLTAAVMAATLAESSVAKMVA